MPFHSDLASSVGIAKALVQRVRLSCLFLYLGSSHSSACSGSLLLCYGIMGCMMEELETGHGRECMRM